MSGFSGFVNTLLHEAGKEKEHEGEIMKIKTVSANTFSMDYFSFGQGEKNFVILPGVSVQSVMGSAEAIAEAYKPLADNYTVYVFDRRKNLPDSYTVYDMARDTAVAFDVLGLERVCLFGASQGGMMAMVIAVTHPELIDKLVLGSTAPSISDEQFGMFEKMIGIAGEKRAEELYLAFGEVLYPANYFQQVRGLFVDAAKTVTEEDLKRFSIMTEGLKGFDITAELKKIISPVLVLGDRTDRIFGSEGSETIAKNLKNSRDVELYLYDGYGHAVYDTAPDYKKRILNFLLKDAVN